MKNFLLGTVALIALGATVPALAADMAARPYTKAAPVMYAPIYNWTGFYIGGHVGGAFGGSDNILAPASPDQQQRRALHRRRAGRLRQAVRPELGARASKPTTASSTPTTSSFANRGLGSVTGRLGYTWGPAMLYVKGGYAWADSRLTNGFGGALTPAAVATATPSAAVSNTCSPRTGRARSNTSTTTSAPGTLSSPAVLASSRPSGSATTSTPSRSA